MFNSMLRKEGNNQQEEDLLFLSNKIEPSQLELSMVDPLSSKHL
jgi:hypothetical protein